jgi:hypothetical protein
VKFAASNTVPFPETGTPEAVADAEDCVYPAALSFTDKVVDGVPSVGDARITTGLMTCSDAVVVVFAAPIAAVAMK